MKTFISVFIVLMSFLNCKAQYNYNDFTSLVNNVNDLYLQFSFDAGDNVNDMTGKLFLNKSSYRLELANFIIFNNGSDYVNFNKDTNEATLFNASDDELNVASIFNLCSNGKPIPLTEDDSIASFEINAPVDLSFSKVIVYIDKQTNFIDNLIVFVADNQYEIKISDYNVNQNISADVFNFDQNRYPDVTLIDMR